MFLDYFHILIQVWLVNGWLCFCWCGGCVSLSASCSLRFGCCGGFGFRLRGGNRFGLFIVATCICLTCSACFRLCGGCCLCFGCRGGFGFRCGRCLRLGIVTCWCTISFCCLTAR